MSSNLRRHRQNGPGQQPPQILHLTTQQDFQEEQKFETLFTVDEKEYFLWVNPPATIGLHYLNMSKESGQEAAAVWLLEQMIGEDGYKALMNVSGLKASQLRQIMEIAKDHAMGEEEDSPPGN